MLSDLLHDLSTWSFRRLSGARRAGFEMREESITEHLLLDLAEHPDAETRIYKTSTGQEPKYGPDWLWSVYMSGMNLTMWVQAKKATGSAFLRYDGLKGPHAKQQAIRLLLNAQEQGAAPVYAFFNCDLAPFADQQAAFLGGCARQSLTRCDVSQPWSNDHHKGGCSPCGVTIADGVLVAEAVFSTDPQHRHASHVNGFAMPWECVVCPNRPLSIDPDSPGGPSDTRNPLQPRFHDLVSVFSDLANHAERIQGRPLPFGLSLDQPAWVTQLRETGTPFGDAIEPSDVLSMPEYYVSTVIRQ